ncbi:MAG: DUF1624 domain-containing protein [Pedobacter sp.]|jgi:uncharacterized membrane protein|nr:MAG: DUF1624 domain-containing protein [Pedobacter sp.]
MKKMRNKTFDTMRGLAIMLMILANAAPLYQGEFPFMMRVLFSLPAPMFIMISGFMLALGYNKHSFSYFLKRGLFIVVVAVGVDIGIHHIYPFQTFDVLYLIGFSMPLVILALRLNIYVQYAIILVICVFAEFARGYFGYMPIGEYSDFNLRTWTEQASYPYVRQWLLNGDFPIFPWMGVMLFGSLIGKLYILSKDENFFQGKFFLNHAFCMVILGGLLLIMLPRPNMYLAAEGYAEVFYEAHTGLLMCLLLFPMVILFLSSYLQWDNLFVHLGRSSLAIYILHLFLIHQISAPLLGTIASLQGFYLLYVGHFIVIYGAASSLVRLKAKYNKMPALVAWIIGT